MAGHIAVLLLSLVLSEAVLSVEQQFASFVAEYQRTYTDAEALYRQTVFADNLKSAQQLQAADPKAQYGVTQFMDLTPEEFAATFLMEPQDTAALAKSCLRKGVYLPRPNVGIPDSFDWRTNGTVVTDVKNQGGCGSCWAFSTAANIEGLCGVAGHSVGSLSPQYIVDCSKGCSSEIVNGQNETVCNQGCQGGWPWTAYQDIIESGGLPGWDDYPYTGTTGQCKGNKNSKVLVPIRKYTCIGLDKKDNEDEMAEFLVQLGPLSIAINANPFQYYIGGILDPPLCETKQLDHAVLLVGYGTANIPIIGQVPYWIVKNSWGSTWGEKGYVRIVRGSGKCGINEAVSCGILS